jgi:HEAT repeat protein
MIVAKFLRRTDQNSPDGYEQALRDIEDILPSEDQTGDTQAVTNAVLKKLDIFRDRPKKMKMIRALAHLDAPWVPSVLLELLGDGIEEVRDMAVRELAQRDDWPAAALYERLDRPPWYAKSAALRILAERKDKESVPHIKRLIDDPNVDVKRAAALALGAIGGSEARSLLVRLARDQSHYVRTAAEEMLERLCDFKFS